MSPSLASGSNCLFLSQAFSQSYLTCLQCRLPTSQGKNGFLALVPDKGVGRNLLIFLAGGPRPCPSAMDRLPAECRQAPSQEWTGFQQTCIWALLSSVIAPSPPGKCRQASSQEWRGSQPTCIWVFSQGDSCDTARVPSPPAKCRQASSQEWTGSQPTCTWVLLGLGIAPSPPLPYNSLGIWWPGQKRKSRGRVTTLHSMLVGHR